jgi:hypothetical protein
VERAVERLIIQIMFAPAIHEVVVRLVRQSVSRQPADVFTADTNPTSLLAGVFG